MGKKGGGTKGLRGRGESNPTGACLEVRATQRQRRRRQHQRWVGTCFLCPLPFGSRSGVRVVPSVIGSARGRGREGGRGSSHPRSGLTAEHRVRRATTSYAPPPPRSLPSRPPAWTEPTTDAKAPKHRFHAPAPLGLAIRPSPPAAPRQPGATRKRARRGSLFQAAVAVVVAVVVDCRSPKTFSPE